MAEVAHDRTLNWYATREPVVILLLGGIALAFFFAVTGLSAVYQNQQKARGNEWFTRGAADLKAGRAIKAVDDFQVALSFSRDNYGYQLSLAEALMATNRKEDREVAHAYLVNLWQREPENGTVNLQLARLFAEKGDVNQAIRYYHNAIYAVWNNNPDEQRRMVRLELVEFLLQHQAMSQAEAELIAMAGNLPDNASVHIHVGDLFMQIPDYERAFDQYRQSLKLERDNAVALAAAGRAAFELGRYPVAERYLGEAVAADPEDSQSANLLKTTRFVLIMDPYRLQLSTAKRNQAVVDAFQTAGQRLEACLALPAGASDADLQDLELRWNKLRPRPSLLTLRTHPDLVSAAMDLVFEIERRTRGVCGAPAGKDLALLLIARQYEGN